MRIHPALPAGAFTTAARLPTCAPAVAVLQVADWDGPRAGMVAAESALHTACAPLRTCAVVGTWPASTAAARTPTWW